MTGNKKILLIECCNFSDFPTGGQLSFAKHMLSAFENEVSLVGITTEQAEPVGIWYKKRIKNIEYDCFSVYYKPKSQKKPFIPVRLRNLFALRKYKKEILSKHFENVIVQAPESLFAISNWNYSNICYRFAGTDNPLSISRYKIGKLLAFLFDKFFFPKLVKSKKILAAGDRIAIENMVKRSKGLLTKNDIVQFPTRFDSALFKKYNNVAELRSQLGLNKNETIVITTGRLGWYKGWKFMIDSFVEFRKQKTESQFFFIGDGEDFFKIVEYIKLLNAERYIFLTGYLPHLKIAEYQNAADLFIMGSYKEGWSTSLVEAVACGLPACVTNFSSANEIIRLNINGIVVNTWDTSIFAQAMIEALAINRTNLPNIEINKYALSELKMDLLNYWELV